MKLPTTLAEALGIDHPEADYERRNFWKGSTPVPVLPNQHRAKMHTVEQTDQFHDQINNPPHYTAGRKYEPIDVISDWELDFCLGNVVKYISRAGRKGKTKELEDLQKARFYLDYKISLVSMEQS